MTYRLKRPVEISVRWVEERWAPRCLVPAHWSATIVANGPRSFRYHDGRGPDPKAAVAALIEMLKRAGYTGTARVERGGVARPPWR